MSKRLINRRQFLTETGSTLALGAMIGVLSPSVARSAASAQATTGEVLVIGAGNSILRYEATPDPIMTRYDTGTARSV